MQTNRVTEKHRDTKIDVQAYNQREGGEGGGRERERERERQRETETETQRETQTETQTNRQTETELQAQRVETVQQTAVKICFQNNSIKTCHHNLPSRCVIYAAAATVSL